MGISEKEARRRRSTGAGKERHPIAAIEKRVIHSQAFADLAPSSVVVMLLLAANQAKDRNGHMQLSEGDAARHGIERKTLRRALRDLVEHGFLHLTKRGGKAQGHCSKYAFTWQPITHRDGLTQAYIEAFGSGAPFTYDRWAKNIGGQKRHPTSAQNVPLSANSIPKISLCRGTKSTLKSINTNTHGASASTATTEATGITGASSELRAAWIPDYIANLERAYLAGRQCFQIPEGVTVQ